MKTGKVLCMLLASLMLLSLCACGGSASSPSGTQTVTSGPSTSGTQTETAAPSASEAVTASETETETEAEESFSIGSTVNNTYENEFFGIGITLDDNWVFATQEEINEINGLAQDVLDNELYTEALEAGTVYTDMSAHDNDGLLNINTTIEKLNAVNTFAIDEEKYIDITLEENDFKALFEEMGLDVSVVEKGVVTIAGEEHPCIVIEGDFQGISFYEKVAVIKEGNYVISITVSSITENVVDDLLASFYGM